MENIIGFTHSCFLRHNTPELVRTLKQMGMHQNVFDENCENEILIVDKGVFISRDYDTNFNSDNYLIDCGDNEQLFLSIAALNNNTDKYQWFWSTGWTMGPENIPIPDKWVYCDQDTLEHFAWVNNSPNSYSRDIWHKATINDLIEHFK
jgi:hypothetical protein